MLEVNQIRFREVGVDVVGNFIGLEHAEFFKPRVLFGGKTNRAFDAAAFAMVDANHFRDKRIARQKVAIVFGNVCGVNFFQREFKNSDGDFSA